MDGERFLAGRKVLILVSEDWYFCSHRLPIAKALRDAGAEVVVATRVRRHGEQIRAAGLRVAPIAMERAGRNPFYDLRTIVGLTHLYRRERPDIVHHVALKPTLYGGIAAWLTGVPAVINAVAGVGFLFASNDPASRLLRPFVRAACRLLLNRPRCRTILQNPDDLRQYEERFGIAHQRLALIRGSGVDTEVFRPSPAADGVPVAACVTRMLWDKGIQELVEAAQLLKARGVPLRVRLIGAPDETAGAIPETALADWNEEGTVEVVGRSEDVPGELRRAHIVVLPSYRGEGVPKALLEGAAAGLPLVATDVPGCREICLHEETGLLVPARTVEPLADALALLAGDPAMRTRLGSEGRRLVEAAFAEPIIVAETLALYRELAGRLVEEEATERARPSKGIR